MTEKYVRKFIFYNTSNKLVNGVLFMNLEKVIENEFKIQEFSVQRAPIIDRTEEFDLYYCLDDLSKEMSYLQNDEDDFFGAGEDDNPLDRIFH